MNKLTLALWGFFIRSIVLPASLLVSARVRVSHKGKAVAAEMGIFGVLVFGAISLVIVSIVLLFGMDIAGEFAQNIDVNNDYSDEANSTVNSTGNAFELFGTSVLVIPAAAVLAVLITGMVGAVSGIAIPGGGNRQMPGRGR